MINDVTNHLWQSTVFAIGVGLLTLAFRKNRAQVRYWLWFSASLKFLIPFSLLLGLGGYLGRSAAVKDVAVPAVTYTIVRMAEPFPQALPRVPSKVHHLDWLPIALVSIWAFGLGCIALIRLRGWLRIRAAVRSSVPMDIPYPVQVRCSPTLLEPGIVGFFRPLLLFPVGIVDRLAANQLQAVLAHELCHLRRRDNLTAAMHMVVEAVFWFHPFTWWISSRLIAERERACDEGVLESGAEPQAYAETIMKTCQFYAESPLACVPGVTGADLKKRMVRIMTGNAARNVGFLRKLLLCAVASVGIAAPVVFGLLNTTRIRAASQSPNTGATTLAFETVTIKRHKPTGDKMCFFFGWTPEGFTDTGLALAEVIQTAFGVQPSQISGGPEWLRSEPYHIVAKFGASVANELEKLSPEKREAEEQRMLQSLLADRLHIATHREINQLPVYALVLSKKGPKLRETKPVETSPSGTRGNGPEMQFGPGELTAQGVSIADMVQDLAHRREVGGRMVVDHTGLTGKYDFTLRWSPERPTSSAGQSSDNAAPSTSSAPPLFTALEEHLGLELETITTPVGALVIDHVERPTLDE